jgi:putative membrane protein insertion efficiency factor
VSDEIEPRAALRRVRSRRAAALISILLVAGISIDLSRPAASQLSASAAVGCIHFYQRHLSRFAAATGAGCRFQPTCSVYAERAIRRDGMLKGGWRALARVARCGPWTPMGTVDPP